MKASYNLDVSTTPDSATLESSKPKRKFTRATASQLVLLQALHAKTTPKTASKEDVQELSATTGLTSKYIRDWLRRQIKSQSIDKTAKAFKHDPDNSREKRSTSKAPACPSPLLAECASTNFKQATNVTTNPKKTQGTTLRREATSTGNFPPFVSPTPSLSSIYTYALPSHPPSFTAESISLLPAPELRTNQSTPPHTSSFSAHPVQTADAQHHAPMATTSTFSPPPIVPDVWQKLPHLNPYQVTIGPEGQFMPPLAPIAPQPSYHLQQLDEWAVYLGLYSGSDSMYHSSDSTAGGPATYSMHPYSLTHSFPSTMIYNQSAPLHQVPNPHVTQYYHSHPFPAAHLDLDRTSPRIMSAIGADPQVERRSSGGLPAHSTSLESMILVSVEENNCHSNTAIVAPKAEDHTSFSGFSSNQASRADTPATLPLQQGPIDASTLDQVLKTPSRPEARRMRTSKQAGSATAQSPTPLEGNTAGNNDLTPRTAALISEYTTSICAGIFELNTDSSSDPDVVEEACSPVSSPQAYQVNDAVSDSTVNAIQLSGPETYQRPDPVRSDGQRTAWQRPAVRSSGGRGVSSSSEQMLPSARFVSYTSGEHGMTPLLPTETTAVGPVEHHQGQWHQFTFPLGLGEVDKLTRRKRKRSETGMSFEQWRALNDPDKAGQVGVVPAAISGPSGSATKNGKKLKKSKTKHSSDSLKKLRRS